MWRRTIKTFDLFAKNDFSSENAKNRTDRDKQRQANRSRIAAYCQNCSHCKCDIQRGVLCALTDDYGDFQHECDQFEPSETYIAQKCAERKQKEKESKQSEGSISKEGVAAVFTYIFCMVAMWHEDTPATTIWILLAVGVTLAGAGVAYYLYCRSQLKKTTYGLLNHKKIMELLRVEGYRPQKDTDGDIILRHDGCNYFIEAWNGNFRLWFGWSCLDYPVDQLRVVANSVMKEFMTVKVYVDYIEEEKCTYVVFSVEALIKYEVELQAQLSTFISLIEFSSRRFDDLVQKMMPKETSQRRQSVYNREYDWFANVVDGITDRKIRPELLSDETVLRQGFMQDCAPEYKNLWNAFKILRVEKYGDYKLFLYQFPEPKEVPEALYGAVVFDTKTHRAEYYTLEYSYNDKWVFGSTSCGKHTNYGETETSDLE